MVAYSSKALATAALILGFSSSAFGCLVITGSTWNVNDFADGTITTTDSGVQTCNGNVGTGDNNVDCISGYSLNYDYTDNNDNGPMPITYCNPSNWYIPPCLTSTSLMKKHKADFHNY
ncbi:uncharacterized protein BO88DRAFT_455108 [Aspergillus vadensis CBS 113365]|uniref:Cyanovirin-N domain-containing protein n=1 Tax=Aspergillus vadensis (strain CBS 113365 / IMI 142717 / IBT 24658) TaxID=1448311 RepID=A0A319B5M4_ASPVC|nr:hypothetical protein BO88DRAFT_455108 [Aspergillus vadensis CBS 113365]PYH67629.1 hypothetical protein BO88DRAFT_455108 [Aspergillus vadensis CBS 113365]